jgi:iron(III) transport system permease protein
VRRRGFEAVTLLLFGLLVAPPVFWLIGAALRAGADAVAAGRLLEPRAWVLLGRSAEVALGATAGALLAGIPIGVLIARGARSRGASSALAGAALLTLAVPPYAAAIAWSILLARGGPLAVLLRTGYTRPPPVSATGLGGVIWTLAGLYWPVVALLLARSLRGVPAGLEEAARLECTPGRAFVVAAAPYARPALGAAALLVFLLALADYSVPGTMGVTVYPVEILSDFQAERAYGRAAALALPLLALVTPLVLLQRHLLEAAPVTGSGEDAPPAGDRPSLLPPLPLGRWRAPAFAAAWLVPAVTTLAPLAVLFAESLPLRTYATVALEASDPALLSLQTAGAAALAAAALALAVCVTLDAARALPAAAAGLVELIGIFPYAMPGALIGIALIALLNRPGPLGDLYGSLWVLPVSYVAQFFPFALKSVSAGVRRVEPALVEAARLDGASTWAVTRAVVAPLVRGHLMVAASLVFVLASRELDATALLRPPDGDTLGFHIYDLYHYGPSRQVAALAVLAAFATALLIAAVWRLVDRWRGEET